MTFGSRSDIGANGQNIEGYSHWRAHRQSITGTDNEISTRIMLQVLGNTTGYPPSRVGV